VLYADVMTGSLKSALKETERRRKIQLAHNEKYGITPKTVVREIRDMLPAAAMAQMEALPVAGDPAAMKRLIRMKEKEMRDAAGELNFELATLLREEIKVLKKEAEKGLK